MNKAQIHDISKRIFKIGIGIFILSILFKFMHWPFQKSVSFISDITICIGFLGQYFASKEKTLIQHGGLIAAIIILINLYTFITKQHNPIGYSSYAIFALILAETLDVTNQNKTKEEEPDQRLEDYEFGQQDELKDPIQFNHKKTKKWPLSYYIIGAGTLPVLVGLLFKVRHYPGASILLFVGFGVSAAGVFLMFARK